jgi:hypothetical protein
VIDRKKKRRQSSMFLPAHPSSAGLDPLRANTTTLHRTGTSDAPKAVKGQEQGNARLQQFIKWKLAKDGGLADALAQVAIYTNTHMGQRGEEADLCVMYVW